MQWYNDSGDWLIGWFKKMVVSTRAEQWQDLPGNLTARQLQFLAARQMVASDTDAARLAGIPYDTVANWRDDEPTFVVAYRQSFLDQLEFAKSYSRQLLAKATSRIDEALDATRTVTVALGDERDEQGRRKLVDVTEPDHKVRLEAARLLFQAHGILRDKIDVEVRIRQIASEMGIDPDAAVAEARQLTTTTYKVLT